MVDPKIKKISAGMGMSIKLVNDVQLTLDGARSLTHDKYYSEGYILGSITTKIEMLLGGFRHFIATTDPTLTKSIGWFTGGEIKDGVETIVETSEDKNMENSMVI